MATTLRVGRALWSHPRASRAELEAFQGERLRRLVDHAYARVPFYRDLFDRHGVHPRHVRDLRDLAKLPITSKTDLRVVPAASTTATSYDPDRLIAVTTSGSSGEPLEVRRTWLEQNLLHLFRLRAHRLLGRRLGDRRARIARQRATHRHDNKLVGTVLRRLGAEHRLILGVDEAPEVLQQQLRRFRPDIVGGFANALLRVGERVREVGEAIRPRFVISSSEVLTPSMRARAHAAWEAPVLETYGSHEFNLIAWECPVGGGLHTCDDSLVVEVWRGDRPAEPGERGEVVITALHAYAVPFIRYRLGDVVTRAAASCACGQPFARIEAIQGRMLDYFRLPDGRWMHPYELITNLFSDATRWIARYQLVQEREDRIVLRLVPAPGVHDERIAEFERFAASVVGPGVEVRVQIVPEIKIGPGGKFRLACSHVAPGANDFAWAREGLVQGGTA
jgi:phenylacetate-CoA ligase